VKNHYEMLQVFPTATDQEVKDSFRFMLFRYHPDHNKGREEWAVARTMELVEAYHVLSDPDRRAHYNVMRTMKIREERGKKGFGLFGGSEKEKLAEEEFKAGVAAFRTDEYEQAVRRFGRVIELSPDCANARYNLAAAFLALERTSEAQQWLQEHLGRNKDDAEARTLQNKIIGLVHKERAPRPK